MPITLVNMIPNSLSGETQRDSEPNVSVNPANPLEIAASAFTPDPASSGNGPIYVSTDGGNTWALNVVLPGGNKTGDTSLRFGGWSGVLYAGILRSDVIYELNILRKASFTSSGLMTTLVDRGSDDQPWVEAKTANDGTDRVFVSSNDSGASSGKTATIDQSQDAATAAAPAGFTTKRLEVRGTSGQDGPPVRTAPHQDGTVYGAFLGWRGSGAGSTITSDIVVVRDDNWGSGATPYGDLVDAGDSKAGVRVATGVTLPPFADLLGTQRTGSSAAVAVDPRSSDTVYVAWLDGATGSAVTIHVRRSSDRGRTWTADLRTIATATNPALAIDVRGRVGFLYQQLGNPGTGNRWRTHLEISSDGFATAPTDLLLADVPDANGSYAGVNPIGDYANLIAVGKNFYGVFSANNTPTNANFPNGVTYQRNANFGTHTLLDTNGVTSVAVSIDPFFFRETEVGAGDDFYVRDWTDSPSSGDTGLEPSTHPVFYATSDVWNRRGSLPGSFPNDQPSNEDAGNGTGNIGDNWAFARVRRNVTGTAATVTAHFLVSKFGTGSNYVDSSSGDADVSLPTPDPTIAFAASDVGPFITPAYQWHLGAISSTHLCLAVEISTPADPFVAPSLVGRAPGWPTTDLAVIDDNNKAQRNMGLSTTPARGVGMSDDLFAWIHNPATFRRDLILRMHADPAIARRLAGARVLVAGEQERAFEANSVLVLPNMAPGENRWIRVSFKPPKGKPGETVALFFDEVVSGRAINGFGIGARIGTDAQVMASALERCRSVFTRLAALKGPEGAAEIAEAADELLRKRHAHLKGLTEFIVTHASSIGAIAKTHSREADPKDNFELRKAAEALLSQAKKSSAADMTVALTRLLERLDTLLTALELDRGDPADILQNLRWQRDVYSRSTRLLSLDGAEELVTLAADFVAACGERRARVRDYPKVIAKMLSGFAATARALDSKSLDTIVERIRANLDNLAELQKSHREFLLAIDNRKFARRPR
jgi:hypothetical protein